MLPRLHLFEFLDQPWLPACLRRGGLDYLRTVLTRVRPHDACAPEIAELMQATGTDRIVDLCSGGGGPWATLLPRLREHREAAHVLLTDLYPVPVEDLPDGHALHPEPVDATDVPGDLAGVRTIFEGFHHFRPESARAILQNAVDRRQPIAIYEVTNRAAVDVLAQIVLIVPLVWLFTPLIRPFSWLRLLLTYVLPVLPLIIWWDGIVSSLRTYRVGELERMTATCGGDYEWRIGKRRTKGLTVTHCLGRPKDPEPRRG